MDYIEISSIFFTLFFVVDPLGLIPVFIIYLSGYNRKTRNSIIIKSIIIAVTISIFFVVVGKYLLLFLGISSGSFLVAGGILLFMISVEMLFGNPSKIKMQNYDLSPANSSDISVFPLAIPMLCGPGNIAALLMFSTQYSDNPVKTLILIFVSFSVFIIAMLAMFLSEKIGSAIGNTGISIVQRIIGLILSAISVQFIKNGLVGMNILQ